MLMRLLLVVLVHSRSADYVMGLTTDLEGSDQGTVNEARHRGLTVGICAARLIPSRGSGISSDHPSLLQ